MFRVVTEATGDRHIVVSLTCGESYREPLIAAGVEVHVLNADSWSGLLSCITPLVTLIRSARPDVVQTWMYHADLIGGVAAWMARVPRVIWGIHNSNLASGVTSLSTRLLVRLLAVLSWVLPARAICCSTVACHFHAGLGYRTGILSVVSNGVDVRSFAPDADARRHTRQALGIGRADIFIGMVGRWHPHKDHETLFDALDQLRRLTQTSWRVALVGPGMSTDNPDLRDAIRRYDLAGRVLCLGPRDDISSVMNALDLHVLSSLGEAFGNVTVEAMACGTPGVVTDAGAGAFIVGETGWVVPVSDAARLAVAINQAITAMADRDCWRRRQLAARDRVETLFGVEQMVSEYRQIWKGQTA